jgi:hypothetical protein
MLSPELAYRLKEAGLDWQPGLHDFFWIPDTALEDRIFVISDMQANLELYRGLPVVTFHGVAEWALDYIMQQEVVWIPMEEQLRERLAKLADSLTLTQRADGQCACMIEKDGHTYSFSGTDGSNAYGEALLFLLLQREVRAGGS